MCSDIQVPDIGDVITGGTGSTGGLVSLNVAQATVGPNVRTVVDPGCTVNCGPGGDPDPCVGICLPEDPDLPELPTLAFGGQLAYTGAGVCDPHRPNRRVVGSGCLLRASGLPTYTPQVRALGLRS
ncbi:MAG: hypothetical protein ACOH1M_07980 [Rhodoglobus sp.]